MALTLATTALSFFASSNAASAAPASAPPDAGKAPGLSRTEFNQRAQELFLPLFWRADSNGNGVLDADELAILEGPPRGRRADFVSQGAFTARFEEAVRRMRSPTDFSKLAPEERERRQQVTLELAQGRPTLVETDLRGASRRDQELVARFLTAAALIEKLYAAQRGTTDLSRGIPPDDSASQALFHRNQGPHCEAPLTEKNPACTALPGGAKPVFGLYPPELQADPAFCQTLAKEKNGAQLAGDHFSVVRRQGDGYVTVPYTSAWKSDMDAVASELEAAAAGLGDDEAAFKAYLTAAAHSFRSNDWEKSNAAWVAMSASNSKWYARVAPDEVYSEPCASKAAFALQLARINPDSIEWQRKLEPMKGDLEKVVAGFAGPPYRARPVAFKLPDFIDVVLNAGDQRNAHGGTAGQSLPNWGPLAEKGGRTVVMANINGDPDSQESLREQMASVFCPSTMSRTSSDPKVALLTVLLHEAAHNLGPAHDYAVGGKKDLQAFGGPLASIMEELKAQTTAVYFVSWLAERGHLSQEFADQALLRSVAWAFGQISRGLFDGAGRPRTYSQAASIQMSTLLDGGALTFTKSERAANGTDLGCFEVHLGPRWSKSAQALTRRVLKTKSRADRADAERMVDSSVNHRGQWNQLRELLTERWLRAPKATFVYSLRYD